MASLGAKAARRATVQQRLATSMAALAELFGIDEPAAARPTHDPDLTQIIDLERQADVLDAVLAATAPADDAKPAAKKKAS